MLDLDQAIAAWRQRMIEAGIKAPVPLDELESHLRDAVEEQMRLGLNQAEALEAAGRQLGHAGEMASEFAKANRSPVPLGQKWGERYGAKTIIFLNGLYVAYWTRVLLHNASVSDRERALGFAALVATLLAAFAAWQLMHRIFPIIANRRVESAIVGACVVSGTLWFVLFVRLILPHFEFTPGGLLVTILWAIIPCMVTPAFFLGTRGSEQEGNSAKAA